MRISRDKLNKLAHVVSDVLAETDEAEFLEDRNTIRQEARKALEKLLLRGDAHRPGRPPQDPVPAPHHPRRQPGVGHPLPQVLQRGSQKARHLNRTKAVQHLLHQVFHITKGFSGIRNPSIL